MNHIENHERLKQAIDNYNEVRTGGSCSEASFDILRNRYTVKVAALARTGTIDEVVDYINSFVKIDNSDSRKAYGEERFEYLKNLLHNHWKNRSPKQENSNFCILIFLDNHTVFPIFGSEQVPEFTPKDVSDILELIEAWKITAKEVFDWPGDHDSVIIPKNEMVHFSGRSWKVIKPEIEALLNKYAKPTNV